MGNLWHVGDPHFGHMKVAKYRGFFTADGEVDVEAHDEEVYRSIASKLSASDTVRFYGDLAIDNDWRGALDILKELKTVRPELRFELLYGNHDVIHPLHKRKVLAMFQAYAEVFDWMGERMHNKSDYGRSVHFSHFPAVNGDDRHSDKYKLWQIPAAALNLTADPRHEDWVIHGHTHQKTMLNETRPNHLCVSWDVFRAPVSDNFLKRGILRQLGKKSLSTPVHWGFQEEFREHAEMLQKSGK